jgi:hypothetical protein
MSGSGCVRWPAWTIVTILVVLIGSGITLLASCGADGSGNLQPTDFSKRTGLYAGQSVNKTFDVSGKVTLDITSIKSPNGDVEARMSWSEGLFGSAEDLSGQVNRHGVMHLSGDIYAPSEYAGADSSAGEFYHYDGQLDCKFASTTKIRCTYKFLPRAGDPAGAQNRELSARHI